MSLGTTLGDTWGQNSEMGLVSVGAGELYNSSQETSEK